MFIVLRNIQEEARSPLSRALQDGNVGSGEKMDKVKSHAFNSECVRSDRKPWNC